MDWGLSGGFVDVVQALEVFIFLCLHIAAASTVHHRPFDHKVCGVHAYPLLAKRPGIGVTALAKPLMYDIIM